MPALPLDEAGKYVAGAYVVFVALLVVYLAIMAARIDRLRQDLGELAELAERNGPPSAGTGGEVTTDPDQGSESAGAGSEASGREAEEAADGSRAAAEVSR